MKKRLSLLVMLLCAMLVLSGCCAHKEWTEANCETAKTCVKCGETDGAPLGHSWFAATCETPKTCEVCGKTEGTAAGHTWSEATCSAPKTCSACKATEGAPVDHRWLDATTESPKTCEFCGLTEGDRIITDPRFKTSACQHAFGLWHTAVTLNGDDIELEGFGDFECLLKLKLCNDGTMSLGFEISDVDSFQESMIQYVADTTYAELSASGTTKDQADQAMISMYGMDVAAFAAETVKAIDFNTLFSQFNINAVYYIDGNLLYSGSDWNNLDVEMFVIEGDTLTLEGGLAGEQYTVFQRVNESLQ